MTDTAYHALTERQRRIAHLGSASGILSWDNSVMMPKGAAAWRGETMATLAGLMHEMGTAPEVADQLDQAENEDLTPDQARNLALLRRSHTRATALPGQLVEALSKASSASEIAWREARATDDFSLLEPHLTEVLDLNREQAQRLGERLDLSPYDALLDGFDPGRRSTDVDAVFDTLVAELPAMIDTVLGRQSAPPEPKGGYAIEKQEDIGRAVLKALAYDFDHGRLDVSTHPFTGGAPGDVRITTRYAPDDFTQSLMGTIHECGHALYEQGLPEDWRGQPLGGSAGLAIHETQSLLYEMQLGRSDAVQAWLRPQLVAAFGEEPALSEDGLRTTYRHVARTPIRVDADEMTYPLHVVLRYRLERAMLAGDLAVKDLPEAWNAGMTELVGYTPTSNAEGCLQDIHWPMGAFGYFPTYSLGAMGAAQIFQAALDADAAIPDGIERGDFAPLLAWLRTNIHEQGSRHEPDALMERATGAPLGADTFLAHLRGRYVEG
ncbi:MAG: carboxypeptidase M32 [Pseudomonadota bacterium]